MTAHKRPEPIRCRDEQGQKIVKVAMDSRGRQWAVLNANDFDRIMDMGVSLTWFFNASGAGHRHVKAYAPAATGGLVSVARLVLDLGPREVVSYVTKDHLDLRRGNLQSRRGRAKRTDAALCGPVREAA